jgi:hypothetical protein
MATNSYCWSGGYDAYVEKTIVETLLVAAEALPASETANLFVAFYITATQQQ